MDPSQTQMTSISSNQMPSLGSQMVSKYDGLISQPWTKVLRNMFINYLSYMDSIIPQFSAMHVVVSIWRLVQLWGVTFFANFDNAWDDGIPKNAINVVSIFTHLIPASARAKASSISNIAFIVFFAIFYGLWFSSVYYLKKNAKLPKSLVIFINIITSTLGLLIPPVMLNLCGESVSRMIMGINQEFNTAGSIVVIIFAIIIVAINVLSYKILICVSLIFRPFSLQVALSDVQDVMIAINLVVTSTMSVASHLSKIPKIVIMALSMLVYVYGLKVPFLPGGIINIHLKKGFLAAIIASIINTLIFIIYVAVGRRATQIELFILVLIGVISYIAAHFIIITITNKTLAYLDAINDNIEEAQNIKHSYKMTQLLCVGMEYSHPLTVSWQLFNISTEMFPEDATIWMLYAKFVAIYPEESSLLGFIMRNMISHNLKGFRVRQMIVQANSVQMQRESNLTANLKRKLRDLSKSVTSTKTKLRHIWDLIIQGTTNEMENAVRAAYSSVDKTRNDFLHAVTQYPNNRFIARAYARFLYEVIGDPDEFTEWHDKINQLKNGILISKDLAHVLGLSAYPNLPETTFAFKDSFATTQGQVESELFTGLDSEINDEPTKSITYEQTKLISTKIDNISIPSINCTIITSVVLFVIFILGIGIGVYIYATIFEDDTDVPLNFLYHMSLIRIYNFMIPLWIHHYIMENIPQTMTSPTPTVFDTINFSNISLEAFENRATTLEQLHYIVTACTESVESLTSFHSFKPNDQILAQARTILYDPILEYRDYSTETVYQTRMMSLQSILSTNLVLSSDFLSTDNSTSRFFTSAFRNPYTLNTFMSAQDLNTNITSVLSYVEEYLKSYSQSISHIVTIVEICASFGIAVVFIVTLVIVIYNIGKDKNAVYRSLTALPKNVVYSASESLRIITKNAESSRTTDVDVEVSKQEDAMLKLFATATDFHSTFSVDIPIFIFLILILGIMSILITIFSCNMLPQITETLNRNSPHITTILGTSTYMMGVLISLNDAVVGNFGYSIFSPKNMGLGQRTSQSLMEKANEFINYFYDAYHTVRYGTEDVQTNPYSSFQDHIESLNFHHLCPNTSNPTYTVTDSLNCLPVEYQILMFSNLVHKYSTPFLDSAIGEWVQNLTYDTQGEIITNLWYLSVKIYSNVLYPMFNGIIPSMKSAMNNEIIQEEILVIIFAIIALIVLITIILVCISIRDKLRFTLKLLLHINPDVVTSTARVMEILSGNFRTRQKDMTLRDKIYYDNVLKEMPNTIIIADQNFKVITVNRAFERVFPEIDPEKFINTDIRQFFKDPGFEANEIQIANNQQCNLVYKTKENVIHLLTEISTIAQTYIITMSDISQTVSYNQLIKEERNKSDKLLASILPPNLVTRVQSGEKNISFAVPSASILFMDIVEFTPWCASGTAQYVMSMLNLLYKYFDADLAEWKTLTKIKCIGDCYMAAGGIFSEMNQPSVHSKEMVEFGLKAIESINQLNKEKNESLRIRVGINTGGPIVAGVLGTEKPTFEILGPAINMAQQMEHNGVPMQVHISRSVYELIYGGPFIIKERGQIQIKNGKVVTYLVEGKNE